MIKELFLALIFGALIGFGLSGTFFGLKKKTLSPPITNPSPTIVHNQNLSPTPTTNISTSTNSFEIISPSTNSVSNQSSITIKGTYIPNSLIVVSTLTDSYQVETDSSGSFSVKIDLQAGANHLKLSAISSTGDQQSQELWVTYSTAKIE